MKDLYTFEDWCQVATESSQYAKSVVLEHWQFRYWRSGKSSTKVKRAKIPAIVTFKTVVFKKGERELHYNTKLGAPLKKLDFLMAKFKLVMPNRRQSPRCLNQEKYDIIMNTLVPAMPEEKKVCSMS